MAGLEEAKSVDEYGGSRKYLASKPVTIPLADATLKTAANAPSPPPPAAVTSKKKWWQIWLQS